MLPYLIGLLGVSGAAYALLRYFWPTWYLDWLYTRIRQKSVTEVMAHLEKGNFLIDVFEEHARKHPEKTFIIFEDTKYTYGYMDAMANRAARAVLKVGAKPGDIVAVMIHNEPAIVWTYLGFMKAGIQTSFMNFNLRHHSLSHCINNSGATFLVVGQDQELEHAVSAVVNDIPNITVYLHGCTADRKPPAFLSWDDVMLQESPDAVDRAIRKHVTLFTPSVYIYTSGTTGLPKPAIVHAGRVLSAGCLFTTFGMTSDDVVYQALPMYHSAALLLGFGNTVTKGATMVLRKKFSASHFWEECRKYDVTIIQYIGESCRYLVTRPKDPMDSVHKIRVAFGNGLRRDIWAEFQSRFKIPQVVEFYAATEGPAGFVNFTNRFGACGRSSPYLRKTAPTVFVKFDVGAQGPLRNVHGHCVPVTFDEVGLLLVPLIAGKTYFAGYRGSKEATQRKLVHDVFVKGDVYFNSGDLMKFDREYYVYFSDRVGDTFRWKGENVSTTEVGNMLTDIDFIHDANVYGVTVPGNDGRAGMASLTLNDHSVTRLTPEMVLQISNHVTESLPSYARPRFLRLQTEVNMTATFKQQKMHLVSDGFDVTKVKDPVYYLNTGMNMYIPLDYIVYTQILAGNVPL